MFEVFQLTKVPIQSHVQRFFGRRLQDEITVLRSTDQASANQKSRSSIIQNLEFSSRKITILKLSAFLVISTMAYLIEE